MNLLSLVSHAHARTASPLAAPATKAQGKTSSVSRNAASSTTGSTTGSSGTSGSSGSSTASSDPATITANDFLTLLVTEIQNQDPTSQTDPMTYITQLVGVNSLEELMQINSTLSTALTPATTASSESGTGTPAADSAKASAAIQNAQLTTGAASGTSAHQLSAAANGPANSASTNAVAQAFTHPAVMPQQVAPLTQVPLNPDVLRALEHSIPGAKLAAPASGVQ